MLLKMIIEFDTTQDEEKAKEQQRRFWVDEKEGK